MNNSYLLPHYFIENSRRYHNKIALVVSNYQITYQQLYSDVCRFVYHLKQNFIDTQDRVVIFSGNTYLSVIAFWATVFCDAVVCLIDPGMDHVTLEHLIHSLTPKIIVTTHELKITGCYEKFIFYEDAHFIQWIGAQDHESSLRESQSFKNTESDLAMIMHTSGSTDLPKGVMLSHRNVLAALESIQGYLLLNQRDVILSVLPMHFDYGLYQMLLSIFTGSKLILEKDATFPIMVLKKIEQECVTVLPLVPVLSQLFYASQKAKSFDLSSVRIVTNTGERLTEQHILKIKNTFQLARIFSMYGLTECKRCSYVPPEKLSEKIDSIGIPMPNLLMRVADTQGNFVSADTVGELIISGPTVMQGYWKNTAETEKKLFYNDHGQRCLRTGDYVLMDCDGYFYFKGRRDDQVKFKGAKCNLSDYVKRITQLVHVTRAYIYLRSDDLIVCVEVDAQLSCRDALRSEIINLFPAFQQPTDICFMHSFPALSNGKVDYNTLKQQI